jgi:predicted Zn finger-like uncharacterized protein
MQIECPNCRTGYEIDDTALDNGGKDMVCSRCGHKWFQTLEALQEAMAAAIAEAETMVSTEEDEEEIDTSALLDSIDESLAGDVEEESGDVEGAEEEDVGFDPPPPEDNPVSEDENSNPVLGEEDDKDKEATEEVVEEDKKEDISEDATTDTVPEDDISSDPNEADAQPPAEKNEEENKSANTDEDEFSSIGAASSEVPPVGSASDDLDSISIDAALNEGAEITTETSSEDNNENDGENSDNEDGGDSDEQPEGEDSEAKQESKGQKAKVKLNEVKGKIKDLTDEQKQAVRKYMVTAGAIILFVAIVVTGFTENSHRIPVVGPVYELLGMSEEIPGKGLEFNNVRTVLIKEDGAEYVEVKGYILNITEHVQDVPLLLFEAYDENANLIKEKKVAPLKDKLAPGVNVNFVIRETKSTDAVRFSVTFAPLPEEEKQARKDRAKQENKITEKPIEKNVEKIEQIETPIKKEEPAKTEQTEQVSQ